MMGRSIDRCGCLVDSFKVTPASQIDATHSWTSTCHLSQGGSIRYSPNLSICVRSHHVPLAHTSAVEFTPPTHHGCLSLCLLARVCLCVCVCLAVSRLLDLLVGAGGLPRGRECPLPCRCCLGQHIETERRATLSGNRPGMVRSEVDCEDDFDLRVTVGLLWLRQLTDEAIALDLLVLGHSGSVRHGLEGANAVVLPLAAVGWVEQARQTLHKPAN
mmetsp:Transcript_9051/g.22214  ORF Transcript_9051/g.22214 Transcript_9051/m.22214 type:complete len:216 (+) Transcript_9051:3-650(+)